MVDGASPDSVRQCPSCTQAGSSWPSSNPLNETPEPLAARARPDASGARDMVCTPYCATASCCAACMLLRRTQGLGALCDRACHACSRADLPSRPASLMQSPSLATNCQAACRKCIVWHRAALRVGKLRRQQAQHGLRPRGLASESIIDSEPKQ